MQPPLGANEDLYLENGRWYDLFRRGKYLFPVDENEKERLDMFHQLFLITRNKILHSAPIQNRDNPRVLDLGCGTGIWAIDVADMYYRQGGSVTTVDLCRIQPEFIPANLSCVQADIEEPWPSRLTSQPWDLIRSSMLYGSISNWPALYDTIYRNLKPTDGYIEQVEIDFTPRCDDGTLAPNSALREWSSKLFGAMNAMGRSMQVNSDRVAGWMMNAGFTEFHEETFVLPFNSWPTAPTGNDRHIGRWFNLGFMRALEALTLAPLFRRGGVTYEQIQDLISRVTNEVGSRDIHAYCLMYVWTARRST